MNMHVAPAAADDRDLIRLCKKTIEALKADLAACNAKCDLQEVFEELKPQYPWEAGKWRAATCANNSAELQKLSQTEWAKTTPSYRTKIRAEIKVVSAWEKQVADLRRSTGLRAAEAKENRAIAHARTLLKQVIDAPAHSLQGVAAKAGIVEHWFNAGYGLDDAAEGYELVMVILDDIRLIGGDAGSIRLLRGHSDEPPPEHQMAGAA